MISNSRFPVLAAALGLVSLTALADADPAYKYVAGQCVNAAGKVGLNKGYQGDCGDLHGANLAGKNLQNLSLRGADLGGAKLGGAQLQNANLENADLSGVQAEKLVADGAKFIQTNLTGSVFTEASFKAAAFTNAKLKNVSAARSSLTSASFTRSDLTSADFTGADLTSAKFPGSLMYETNFTGAKLVTANFTSVDLSFAILAGAHLDGANLTSASLYQTDLSTATGEKAIFASALIRESNFTNANFKTADFSSAQITDSTLDGAALTDGIYRSTLFRGNSLKGSFFDRDDLRLTHIEGCALDLASFAAADFRMSTLQADGWGTAMLKGAKINSRTHHAFTADDITRDGIILIGKNSEVGLLYDNNYVDAGPTTTSEATNLMNLIGLDLSISTTEYTAAKIKLDLDSVGIYVIPELENGDLPLTPDEVSSYKNFVNDGGNLVIFSTARTVVEAMTGVTLVSKTNDPYPINLKNITDLGLATAVTSPTLVDLSATQGWDIASLPMGALPLYGDMNSGVTAFYLPMGKGAIWYLGWDFYDFHAEQNGMKDWGVLTKAILAKAQHP